MTPDQGWLATGTLKLQRARECVLDVARQIGGAQPSTVTLTDLSRFGNDGAMTNVTWTQLASGLWVMTMDGTSYVDVTDAPSLDIVNEVTMMCWVYHTDLTGFQRYINKTDLTPNYRLYQLGKIDTHMLMNIIKTSDTSNTVYSGAEYKLSVDEWYLVAGNYDKNAGENNQIVYMNGFSPNSGTYTGAIQTSNQDLFLGGYNAANPELIGYMAMARVYNFALPPQTILNCYNNEKALFGL